MSDVTLEEDADYGRLPFDIFVSVSIFPQSPVRFCSDLGTQDRWDHNYTGDSREQWERLVWEWESLTLIERYVCSFIPGGKWYTILTVP